MGHWGVRSYENDDAGDALDAGFDRVHGAVYDDLMDDRNPLSVDQIQAKLASPETLIAASSWFAEEFGDDPETWDEEAKLAFAGVIVRHAELRVSIPEATCLRALSFLELEAIDWEEATTRRLRRENEMALLRKAGGAERPGNA